jgi:hypothetical protein
VHMLSQVKKLSAMGAVLLRHCTWLHQPTPSSLCVVHVCPALTLTLQPPTLAETACLLQAADSRTHPLTRVQPVSLLWYLTAASTQSLSRSILSPS